MPFFDDSNFYPEMSPGYLVRVVHQMSTANLDALFAEDGLTATQWSALISIHFANGSTCKDLARSMAHDKGAMTRMIDVFEERGWVERQRDAEDRRIVNLSLTEAGYAVAMRAREKAIACWNTLLGDWSEAEITAMLATLRRLRTAMEKDVSCAD